MQKVMVIGIDGAGLDVIEAGIALGLLPTFESFFEKGVAAKLHSSYPPSSVPAWNVFSSGKSPSRIGVPWFIMREEGTCRFRPFVYDASVDTTNFWDYAGKAGRKVGVLNVPSLFKVRETNGFMVSGFFKPRDLPLTYPEDLAATLNDDSGKGYIVDFWDLDESLTYKPDWNQSKVIKKRRKLSDDPKWYLNRAREVTVNRCDSTIRLMSLYPDWQLFVAVFTSLDRVAHKLLTPELLEPRSPLMEYYVILDQCLDRLMKAAGEDTDFVVVSDHGMQPSKWNFNINAWLEDIGLLHLKKDGKDIAGSIRVRLANGLKTTLLPLLSRYPKLKRRMNKVRIACGMGDLFQSGGEFSGDLIDWTKTKAYGLGNYGEIFVGPFTEEHTMSAEERQSVIDHISQQFQHIKFPWSVQSKEILTKSQMYPSAAPYLQRMPDLMLKIDDFSCTTLNNLGDRSLFNMIQGGVHDLFGIFLAQGGRIKSGSLSNPRIEDIAPTVLQLLGVAIPDDTDGRVLEEMITDCGPVNYQKADVGTGPGKESSVEEDPSLKEQLRALGYL